MMSKQFTASNLVSLTKPTGIARPIRTSNPIETLPGSGSIVLNTRTTRPLWFDGRFLAASDLERDQTYFLQRQADLGRAGGFGVAHGLWVDRFVAQVGQPPDAEQFIIQAGVGVTPGGGLVMLSSDLNVNIADLPDEENLDEQFGLSSAPASVARTRTGLYVIALRPVQFTANPITSYPTSIQGSQRTHDGNTIEATAVSLVPFPLPSTNYSAATQNAAAAWQVFLGGNSGTLSDSLLPLAMISIERDAIQWIDPYLVRRDSGPQFDGLRFGLADPAAQQAFLFQYDGQLQSVVNALVGNNQTARFAATDYFQALPSAGRLPLASIDPVLLTQLFFPQQTDVRLCLIPQDELPAVLDDSLSLPPIDLTQPTTAYADLSVSVLVPLPRQAYAAAATNLPPVALGPALPQVRNFRAPLDLLQFYRGGATGAANAAAAGWQAVFQNQVYGYYIRTRGFPVFISPDTAATATTTSLNATSIAGATGLTLIATVTPSDATGTVSFSDGATALGTVDMTGGAASVSLPLAAGSHVVTAIYNGDASHTVSASPAQNATVVVGGGG